ncbi:hypothetical protein GALMADRAFT_885861 [Galerina marginata CBS 339.88]|uniref:Uncharacterized protein n=1 Tax=Galerina marginata (strain CBS 339.88) TaxID=685588 RepID=A0A067SS39_GALM3|nr:hypothetical protein GALMADRAFT_885861 [Galerina marginata CBS 339.88]
MLAQYSRPDSRRRAKDTKVRPWLTSVHPAPPCVSSCPLVPPVVQLSKSSNSFSNSQSRFSPVGEHSGG